MSAQPADERNAPVNSDPSPGGTDGTYASAPMAPVLAPANGLGTTGMVLGIVGAALCLVPVVGFVLALIIHRGCRVACRSSCVDLRLVC
jgi:hypothetical protein